MSPELLQIIPVFTTVTMAFATVAALAWGIWTYRRNGEMQTQLIALQTLQHYLDLAVAHPDLASAGEQHARDARYAWFAAHALVTAQTLWQLVGRQPQWQRSVDAIVRQHQAYLRSGLFVCEDFSPAFVAHLRALVPDLKCARP